MKERLQAPDYRFIAVCLALLAGSIWFSAGNFYRAFPEASIDFRVNRGDAQALAQNFLRSQGYSLGAYRVASRFEWDDTAKTFLEREAGLEQANQIMRTRVRLWRWSFRWFRPQEREEFRADITPGGDVVGFDHEIAEDASRPDITAEQARDLAENFLRTRAQRNLYALEFVESSSVTRPHRTDRSFIWKYRDFDLHDGTYRVAVTILGNEVGGYGEYLKVPDQWTRDYERLRSKNTEAQTFDTFLMLALVIALVAILVMRIRRQDVRWRRAATVGMVGMGLSFLSTLNEFPLAEFGYRTTDGYAGFVMQNLLQALLNALASGGLLFGLAAGAEVMYREAFPEKVSLGNLFSRRGLHTKRFFLGAILGVTLCAIFLAYQTAFYIIANKLGAWSPADVPYSDLLNTKFPWLYVLLGGYLPAVSEEFLFRMFAIPFLRKVVRWLPAAIVLAGFIWGFGHAGYPNQPFFIRGLEVGIGGVALGLIMLRWGILPTLIWHYSVDAMYSAMLLLRSHSLYFRLSGAASAGIFVVPILLALVFYWRRGGFEPVAGLLNGDEPVAEEPPAQEPVAAVHILNYWPLSGRLRAWSIVIFVAGLAVSWIPVTHFGRSPEFRTTAEQSRLPAGAFLRTLGGNPDRYQQVTYPIVDNAAGDYVAKYFLERRTVGDASKLFEQYRPLRYWVTRYFRSLEKEEFYLGVHPETGRILGFTHTIPEDRAGADLSSDAARQVAAQFAIARGFAVDSMDLKESQSEKRKARRDYTLVWEARPGDARNVDETHYRVEIDVCGDAVCGMHQYWKIPETFRRSRDRQNFVSLSTSTVRLALTALGLVFGIWMLIGQIRRGAIPWRRALQLAIIPTAMMAIASGLSFRLNLYRGYDTSVAFGTFASMAWVGLAMQLALGYAMYTAAAALVLSYFPESLSAFRPARRLLALDAVLLLLAAFGLWHVCQQFGSVLTDRFHAVAFADVDQPSLTGLPLPALVALANIVRTLFTHAAILAVGVLLFQRLQKRWMIAVLAIASACAMVAEGARTPAEFALEFVPALVTVACVLAFCLWFARSNYLAYVLVLTMGAVYEAGAELLHGSLETHGFIVLAVVFVGFVWLVGTGLVRPPMKDYGG
jgi:membrane protease YdiL (CAAX protease family)